MRLEHACCCLLHLLQLLSLYRNRLTQSLNLVLKRLRDSLVMPANASAFGSRVLWAWLTSSYSGLAMQPQKHEPVVTEPKTGCERSMESSSSCRQENVQDKGTAEFFAVPFASSASDVSAELQSIFISFHARPIVSRTVWSTQKGCRALGWTWLHHTVRYRSTSVCALPVLW